MRPLRASACQWARLRLQDRALPVGSLDIGRPLGVHATNVRSVVAAAAAVASPPLPPRASFPLGSLDIGVAAVASPPLPPCASLVFGSLDIGRPTGVHATNVIRERRPLGVHATSVRSVNVDLDGASARVVNTGEYPLAMASGLQIKSACPSGDLRSRTPALRPDRAF